MKISSRLQPYLMVAPTLSIIILLFMGGLALAVLQSLGYFPLIGRNEISLNAYYHLLSQRDFYVSLLLTLWLSLASTLLSTLLAIACALALRDITRGQRWLNVILQLNLPIPHLVGAVGILFLFAQSGFLARLAFFAQLIQDPADFPIMVNDPYGIGIILEYVWKETCFITLIILATLQNVGHDYEDVARSLGANRWQQFRYILLPMLMPAILSASMLVFTFSFGAFEVPLLLGQRYPSALPVLAYRYYIDADLNARPEAMAVSVLITLIITLFIWGYSKLSQYYIRA